MALQLPMSMTLRRNPSQFFISVHGEEYEFCIEQVKLGLAKKDLQMNEFLKQFNDLWGFDLSNPDDVLALSVLYNFSKVYVGKL
jgi:hypothetical protein